MDTENMSLEEARELEQLTTRIVLNLKAIDDAEFTDDYLEELYKTTSGIVQGLEKIAADPTDVEDMLEKTVGIVANLKTIEEAKIEA